MSTIVNPYRDPKQAAAYEDGYKRGSNHGLASAEKAFNELMRIKEAVHITAMRMMSVFQPERTGNIPSGVTGRTEIDSLGVDSLHAEALQIVARLAQLHAVVAPDLRRFREDEERIFHLIGRAHQLMGKLR